MPYMKTYIMVTITRSAHINTGCRENVWVETPYPLTRSVNSIISACIPSAHPTHRDPHWPRNITALISKESTLFWADTAHAPGQKLISFFLHPWAKCFAAGKNPTTTLPGGLKLYLILQDTNHNQQLIVLKMWLSQDMEAI